MVAAILMLTTFSSLAQWSTNPAVNNAICTLAGEQMVPKIAQCPNGDIYVGFYSGESGNYGIRLQRLDAVGNPQWPADGIVISPNPQESWVTDWDMSCDNENHCILVFNDIRTGNWNVFAYRVSPAGTQIWGPNGIALSNTTAMNVAPKVITTAAGNIVCAWMVDDGATQYVIMQKLNPAGALQWGANGITVTTANHTTWPQLMPVGADDFIMKFFDDSGSSMYPTRHVFAQRYNASGFPVWGSLATISTAGGITGWTQIFSFINDGSDGFYIAWHDDRDNNLRASAFVQHISTTGTVLYPANGVEVSNASSMNHSYPTLALPPGSADVYVYWYETNGNQDQWGIYGQKINPAGAVQWGAGGKIFIPVSTLYVLPVEARKTPTDMVLFYEEFFNGTESKIKAMRISTTGTFVWSPAQREICSVQSQKVDAVVTEFANNQWVLAWQDNRNGNTDIYAQNIQLDGSLGPAAFGTIAGQITLNGGTGNLNQVTVTAGSYSTHPDGGGNYSMQVIAGTYTVNATLTGYIPASQNNVVVISDQTTTVNLTLNPEPVGYIQGTVTIVGGTGTMGGVTITAGTSTVHPDINGNYTLAAPPGTYNVIATLAAYIPDTVYNITVVDQQTVTGVNFTLLVAPTNGLVTGTVTLNGGTGNVTQVLVSAGGGVATTNPDVTGFYTLDLVAGFYDISASLAGYLTQTILGVQVVVNQTTPNVDFTLNYINRTDMIVTAVDQFNTTLNNVQVVIQGPEGPYMGTITNDSLVFQAVPYGTYNGTATYGGMYAVDADTVIDATNHHLQFAFVVTGLPTEPKPIRLKVVPNPATQQSRVCFTLPAAGECTFNLIDSRGINISRVIRHLEAGDHHLPLSMITGSHQIAEGIYCLRVIPENGRADVIKIIF